MRVVVRELCEVQISRRGRGRGSLGVRGYEGEEDLERRVSVDLDVPTCNVDVRALLHRRLRPPRG